MSKNRQVVKQIQKIYQNISQYPTNIKERRNWLLRTFLVTNKRADWVNSGFIIPTVAMVSLVVVLLTTAILFRSFERAKNARNVRVNEAVLNAATPALDRAKAKLNKLFSDSRLPRATPTDAALETHFATYLDEYTFGDEKQLQLTHSGDTLKSAWRFAVDTDNNGKYDTYTLYGIYFSNPSVSDGVYTRSRNPLEARSIPMLGGNVGGSCGDIIGTSATLVGNSGWFKIGSKLKKSFYVYTTNVPITNPPDSSHEAYKGNQGFSALEYQQERVQLPLVNNAVVYEDDLAITPGPKFRLNGRIITNSNFLTGSDSNSVELYQISSKDSCFYEADNGKIIVGGNLTGGGFKATADESEKTLVHLFKGAGVAPDESNTHNVADHKSVTNDPNRVAYNSLAYGYRIDRLVEAQMANNANTDPQEVQDGISTTSSRREQLELYFTKRTRRVPFEEVRPLDAASALGDYEVGGTRENDVLQGSGNTLRPPDEWVFPFLPSDGRSKTGTIGGNNVTFSNLDLNTSLNKLLPTATQPTRLEKILQGVEQYVGDRISLGNNLPELWWNGSRFVGSSEDDTQNIVNYYWDNPDSTDAGNVRTRRSQIQSLADLGNIKRDGDWEEAAAQVPSTPQDPVGGLRVITGAGIYLPKDYTIAGKDDGSGGITDADFSAATSDVVNNDVRVWSDMLPVPAATNGSRKVKPNEFYEPLKEYTIRNPLDPPVSPEPDPTQMSKQPYLRMRATAVYHYESTNYNAASPTPIACVTSYYDPTNSTTARNKSGLPDVSLRDSNRALTGLPTVSTDPGESNNGVVYPPPTKTVTDYRAILDYQAALQYPVPVDINGNSPPAGHPLLQPRLVNEPLKNALDKIDAGTTLSLSDQSAIDAALCALERMDSTVTASPDDSVIPHGAIKEIAFLDARQIRQIHQDWNSRSYNLPKKDRQPLEIRTTVLDMDLLRQKTIGTPASGEESTQEYLLPNSGIIYASRNDALKDTTNSSEILAPVDFQVDPTRRPNGIMLINGSKLWREENYRDAEKGLILISNLPVYIKGNFNLHTQEEFTTTLDDDWANFYSRTANNLNPNFACRPGDSRLPNCGTGDEWRSAAVLSDAVTLLSDNFREGYRDEGDYDFNDYLNNISEIDTNAYVPQTKWYDDADGFPKDFDTSKSDVQGSSYLNNFVTPIVRRIQVGEYLTEVCVYDTDESECNDPQKWLATTTNNAYAPGQGCSNWKQAGGDACIIGNPVNSLKTGSVAQEVDANYVRGKTGYLTRISFERNSDGSLVLEDGLPVYLGVGSDGKVDRFPVSTLGTKKPRLSVDSSGNKIIIPWFQPQADGTFEPVLQVDVPFDTDTDSSQDNELSKDKHEYWLQTAVESTFNLIIATKDTPSRPSEDNGGLHNFPRFLENWGPGSSIKAKISGSFMQIGRSEYANGPFVATNNTNNVEYPTKTGGGTLPFYRAPARQWGYDVGLLSQSPDLFAFKLVTIPDDEPDEYYREVGRDDDWITTLLCAKVKTNSGYTDNAVDTTQRPSSCPS
ncbi:MAG: hormogonium polysaccharide biosynthesis protein HpsA [Calothrix sp. MO_167.B12]|nr:hormogonium polysaccharide biosynthesis protein HpsA [Calothrix sp. MO_167.B12]